MASRPPIVPPSSATPSPVTPPAVEHAAPRRPVALVRPRRAGRPVPPLGLLSLAAGARAGGEEDLHVVDGALLEGREDLCATLADRAPSVIVVDGEDRVDDELSADLEAIRARLPYARLVLAGGHAVQRDGEPATVPAETLVLRGDAELGLGDLLRALREGRQDLSGLRGLDWTDAGGVLHREADSPARGAVDGHLAPALDLLDPRPYGLERRPDRALLLTSRACPPHCPACHNSFGRTFRARPVEDVLAEAERAVAQGGARELVILDEVFNHDLPRAKALLRGLLERARPTRLRLAGGLRGDRVDAELAELLHAAGLRAVELPVESASPRLQRLLRTNLDLPALAEGVGHLARAGVRVRGVLRFGWPGEDARDRAATRAFAARVPFHSVRFRAAAEAGRSDLFGHHLPTPDARTVRQARGLATLLHAGDPRTWARRARSWARAGRDLALALRERLRAARRPVAEREAGPGTGSGAAPGAGA